MTELINLRDKVWNGSINVKLTFDIGEDELKEYLLTIPRVSYLPIYYQEVIEYFRNFQDISDPIWLEYNSIPVKWNLPVGVIYDFYHIPNTLGCRIDNSVLKLSLKSGLSYPNEILPCTYRGRIDYERSLMDNYFNQLKQSSFVLNGNSKLVMNLSTDNSSKLWESIRNHDLNDYSTVTKRLAPKSINKIPIKIYVSNSSMIQLPVMTNENLNDLLEKYHNNFDAYVQGINVKDLKLVDLSQLWTLFKHLDNFLYIVLI